MIWSGSARASKLTADGRLANPGGTIEDDDARTTWENRCGVVEFEFVANDLVAVAKSRNVSCISILAAFVGTPSPLVAHNEDVRQPRSRIM
jgi:hypothetical protein